MRIHKRFVTNLFYQENFLDHSKRIQNHQNGGLILYPTIQFRQQLAFPHARYCNAINAKTSDFQRLFDLFYKIRSIGDVLNGQICKVKMRRNLVKYEDFVFVPRSLHDNIVPYSSSFELDLVILFKHKKFVSPLKVDYVPLGKWY